MSTERPILFSGPMVRAILEDRKTQTRRVVKRPHQRKLREATDFYPADRWWVGEHPNRHWLAVDIPGGPPAHILDHIARCDVEGFPCHYGQPGDLLWVKERWAFAERYDSLPPRDVPADDHPYWDLTWFAEDYQDGKGYCGHDPVSGYLPGRWRSSRFMPKWACRLWLRVEGVRVERLQEITREDAIAEGAFEAPDEEKQQAARVALSEGRHEIGPRDYFREMWDTINGRRAPWSSNPWVWVVTFSRTEAPNA